MAKRAIKPTALKIINGNPGKRPLPEREPKPRPVAPCCPPELRGDARKVWRELAPMLERVGLMTEADGAALADLCLIRARLNIIARLLNDPKASLLEAVIRVAPDGQERYEYRPNPLTVMERQYMELYRKKAGEFGLSPRGRVGLSIGAAKDEAGAELLS